MTTRFCSRCGAQVLPDANFCPSCGNDLRATRAEAPPPPADPAQPGPMGQQSPSAGLGPVGPVPGVRSFEQEQRMWSTLAHLAAFLGVPVPIVGAIVGPLIVWVLKKDTMPMVDRHGVAAINFQISVAIYAAVSALLVLLIIGLLMLLILAIFDLVMIIRAAVRASNGQEPDYALAIEFLH